MGPRRLGFALLAALIISIGITTIFYLRVTRGSHSKTRPVVAAAVPLQPGTPVPPENLTEIEWPESVPMEGLIDKKDDVANKVLSFAVAKGQPVLRRDLASSSSLGLAAKIPDGMRATAIKTNEVMNVAGFILPNSRVDVLVTLRSENNAASTITRTVLQNVQVLSAGTKMDPDPDGKPENVAVVTLLVTPEQSEKLALAQNQAAMNQGTIHFVLRNGGDAVQTDTPAVDMTELTGVPKPVKEPAIKKARVVKAPAFYTVETIANGKVTIAKFPLTE
jgi:pilus assembly protein CpaB